MGTWGINILDNDTTMDVRHVFNRALSDSKDVGVATDVILHKFREPLQDDDDRPLVYFALAELQIQSNELHRDIAKETVRLIDLGLNLEPWKEADAETLEERQRILDSLKKRIQESTVSERVTSPNLHKYLDNSPNLYEVYVLVNNEGQVRYVGSTMFPKVRADEFGKMDWAQEYSFRLHREMEQPGGVMGRIVRKFRRRNK